MAQRQVYLPYLNDSKVKNTSPTAEAESDRRKRLQMQHSWRLVFFSVCSLIDRKHSDGLSKFKS
jgi:hypothetical protein